MANKIAGLTIEIGGETSGLTKALSGVNKQSKDLQAELKNVDKLLKLDPGNTELLAQKQKLLADAVGTTKSKLDTLREAEKQAQVQFAKGDVSEEQYRALQREVIKTEQDLKKLETQTKTFGSVTKQQLELAGKSFQDVGGKIQGAGKSLAPISGIAAGAITGIVAMGVKAGQSADEINTLAKQTGLSTEEIQKFKYASEIIDVPLETLTGSMAKLTKNMGTAKEGTGEAAEAFDTLGVSITNNDGSLRSNQEVFDETIAKLGEMENSTERDAAAMDIFGKSAQDLNPLILGGADALTKLGDEAEEAGLILSQDALDSANEFNDSIDTLKATATGSFAGIGTEIASALTPMLEDLAVVVGDVMEWIRGLDENTILIILTVLAFVAGLAPLLIIIGQVITAVGTITAALPVLGTVFAFLTGPIGLAIAAIAAIIAIGVLLYKNWDTVKAVAGELWTSITDTFDKIKTTVTEKIDGAKEAVRLAIAKIKGFFNFNWKLPELKMPHFNIKGKFSLNPPQIPKLGVEWYKEGGIFNDSSIIGVGEAGAEAVLPISKLSGILAETLSKMSLGKGMQSEQGEVNHRHSGTVRVEGVNSENQLMAVVDVVMDELRREVRGI